MDIIEFVEKVCGCDLMEYQKEILLKLSKTPPGTPIVMIPCRRRTYLTALAATIQTIISNSRGNT